MNLEGLDCWDDYPYEHGCICGNDCPPPTLPLDPMPFIDMGGFAHLRYATDQGYTTFSPRPGCSQNREDYA